MELQEAPGSEALEEALANPNVHAITDGLIRLKGNAHFRTIAKFLSDNERCNPTKLNALKINCGVRPDTDGNYPRLAIISALISCLEALYAQAQQIINYQRGAIVELISTKIVGSRCQPRECYGNQRFYHNRNSLSKQVDVAVLSQRERRIEAHTCKMNCNQLEFEDCKNLASLAEEAKELNYQTHLSVICFNTKALIELKIENLVWETDISSVRFKAYGLDNFFDLEKNPF